MPQRWIDGWNLWRVVAVNLAGGIVWVQRLADLDSGVGHWAPICWKSVVIFMDTVHRVEPAV